jgi:3-oxoacyl-[acyl-carrier protein] reductase
MPALEGKTCIVTGGASGLGLEIVNQLTAAGAKAAVFDLDEKGLAALADRAGVSAYKCDVTNEAQIEETVAKVAAQGKIDVLVNNVGILFSAPLISFGPSGLKKHDSSMWDKVIATNLSSAFYTSKHVAEAMMQKRTKGVIVNISSVSANGNAGQSAYSAAKAGIEALTKVWAKELAPMGIRCFAVAPGFCDTDSTHAALNQKVLDDTVGRVPLKRLGKANEIASFVVAGIQNDFLNGRVLQIDGGLVL